MLQLPVTVSYFLCNAVSFLLEPTFPSTNNECATKATLFCPCHLNKSGIHLLPPVLTSWLLQGLLSPLLYFFHSHSWLATPMRCIFIHFPTQPTTFSVSLPSVLIKKSTYSSGMLVTTYQIRLCHIHTGQSLHIPHTSCRLNTASCYGTSSWSQCQ